MYNIHRRIPKTVSELYVNLGIKVFWYINLRWMLSHFEDMEKYIPSEARVLDVGCGYGLLANFIALKNEKRSVIGTDFSYSRITIASTTIKNRKNINFIKSDLNELDYTSYQTVAFHDVLHHFPYNIQDELLKRIYKQIKFGGIVLIKELDNRPVWKYCISYMLDTILYLGDSIFYRSKEQWQNTFRKIGFNVKTVPLYRDTILSSILYVCKK